MKKHFLIRKENNQIVSASDDKIIFDKNIFESKKINMTDEDIVDFQQGNIPFFEDNKLKFKPHPDKKKKIEIEKLKEDIEKAKNINELKKIIIDNFLK